MNVLQSLFGKPKAIIAMAHFPALPGQPLHDTAAGIDGILEAVGRDVDVLRASAVDGILFCNENDRPYRLHAGPEQVATMTRVITELRGSIGKPFGVDVLWDPLAAVSIARATGALFVREVFSGAYAGDFGLWPTDPAAAVDLRRRIDGGDIRLFFNITAEFAAPIAPRPIGIVARGAVFSSLADAICVSGAVTGSAADVTAIQDAKAAVGDTAVLANTGVRPDTIGAFLSMADGAIVGTALKYEGITWNAVDPARVTALLAAAEASGEWQPGRPAAAVAS